MEDSSRESGGEESERPGPVSGPWAFRREWLPMAVALAVLVASYRSPRWHRWHGAATAILLALTLGPGLVVNIGLKPTFLTRFD